MNAAAAWARRVRRDSSCALRMLEPWRNQWVGTGVSNVWLQPRASVTRHTRIHPAVVVGRLAQRRETA